MNSADIFILIWEFSYIPEKFCYLYLSLIFQFIPLHSSKLSFTVQVFDLFTEIKNYDIMFLLMNMENLSVPDKMACPFKNP
jgi:hypothetical protein